MTDKTARASLVGAILAIAVVAGAPDRAAAFDRAGARTSTLQRDLRILQPRTLRAPRAAAYDLKRLQRRLQWQRAEAPRDPRMAQLEIEARQLRWQADRAARRAEPDRRLPRTSALVTRAPIEEPPYLGGSHAPPRAPTGAAGFGQRVVAVQRQIGTIEQHLGRGESAAAAGLLEAAAADLAVLRGAVSDAIANDPNLVVLEAQLGGLRQRLE